ncbi:MAG: FmdB family zinc ribbon protein [Gammaproteobacteria bacterium]
MPIYEYMCISCGHDLEVLQKMSDPKLTDCPACGKPDLQKQISAAGFRLKGSGWYETDFKGGGKKEKSEKSGDKKTKATEGCGAGACDACISD